MKLERKLNKKIQSTDLFKEDTGKTYEIKSDHKTILMAQEIIRTAGKTKNAQEVANDKAIGLLIGNDNWKEIKEAVEKMENYTENITIAQIEIYSKAYNQSFEEMTKRFQQSN